MASFDPLAEGYSYWIEKVNLPIYSNLLQEIFPPDAKIALDAGCGPGQLSFYLAERVEQVIGIDISSRMIQVARTKRDERKKVNVDFIVGDLINIPLQPGIFDFIGSENVLHDTPVEITLPVLRKLLKPGGWLFIRDLVAVKPERAASSLWQIQWTLRQVPRYIRQFGPQVTVHLLRFELSPAWVRHKCEGTYLTPDSFRSLYRHYLPGCTFMDYGWAMAVSWQASA